MRYSGLILFLFVILIFSSCSKFSLQKRRYRKGFHFEVANHQNQEVFKTKMKVASVPLEDTPVPIQVQSITAPVDLASEETLVYASADKEPVPNGKVYSRSNETFKSVNDKRPSKARVEFQHDQRTPGTVGLWISFILLMLVGVVVFWLVGIIVAVAAKTTFFIGLAVLCAILALVGLIFLILDLVT